MSRPLLATATAAALVAVAALAAATLAACGDAPAPADDDPAPDAPRVIGPVDPCAMTGARAEPLTVFAAPQVSEQPFLEVIAGANRTLRVMVYQLTSSTIRDAIRDRAAAGVAVSVILDSKQQSTDQTAFDVLTAAGAHVQWSDARFTYTHAKFLVADESVAIVSTGNYDNYMHSGRNLGAIDRDPDDVAALVAIFDADLAHTTPNLACTRLVVAPDNARARHLELLRGATTSLTIESMELADTDIKNAILDRAAAGVAVRVLLGAPSWVADNQAAGDWLVAHGIPARWRTRPTVHVKTFVVDGATAFFGSENLSRTSLSYNREVGLVTTDPADVAAIAAVIDDDWATATPF